MAPESIAHSTFSLMAIDSEPIHPTSKEALATYLSDCKSMLF